MLGSTRRGFLRRGVQVGAALGAAKLLTGCGGERPWLPAPTDAPLPGTARVNAVLGTDLYAMTREALEAVGGMASIINPGETAFIKPNFGGLGFVDGDPIRLGESVKPEIVIVVAEACLQAGAAKVIIGEGGQSRVIPWEQATTLDGTTDLITESERLNAAYPGEVVLASLEVDSPAWDPIPSPHTGLGDVYVSSLLARADRVISIAVIKSHRWCHVTGSMKNFVGATSFDQYGFGFPWRFLLHSAAGSVAQCFLDVVAGIQPDLAIIDGSICCEGNGPHVVPGWWGDTVDVRDRLGQWFMLSSTDPAAADATAARIISHNVDKIPHLCMAGEQGVGVVREDRIELVGASLGDLQIDWAPAEHTYGFGEVLLPGCMLMF